MVEVVAAIFAATPDGKHPGTRAAAKIVVVFIIRGQNRDPGLADQQHVGFVLAAGPLRKRPIRRSTPGPSPAA